MVELVCYTIQYTAPSSASHSFLSSADTPAAPPDTQRSGTTGAKKHVSMNEPTEVLKLTHKEIKKIQLRNKSLTTKNIIFYCLQAKTLIKYA